VGNEQPTVALVMMPGVADQVMSTDVQTRLREAARLISTESYPTPTAIPDELAGEVTVLLTGWGCPRLDAEVLAHLPNLRLVAHAAGTVKSMVTPELYAAGVVVTSAAGANAIPVAEFTVAMIVMASKQVFRIRDDHRARRGERAGAELMGWMRSEEMGTNGRTVGLIGASRTGRLVAAGLANFDVDILVHDPHLTATEATTLGVEKVELHDLCRRSDVVSIHAPELPATKGMIGDAELALVRDGGWVINTARGSLLDGTALEREATSGRLNFALDTTEPEPLPSDSVLYDLPNVVLTPHIAGSLGNEIPRLGAAAVDEIVRFAAGEPPQCAVREVDLDHTA